MTASTKITWNPLLQEEWEAHANHPQGFELVPSAKPMVMPAGPRKGKVCRAIRPIGFPSNWGRWIREDQITSSLP